MTHPSAPLPDRQNDPLDSFVRRARVEQEKAAIVLHRPSLDPAARGRYTAVYGVSFGFVASILFAIISQGINAILLFGLPMYPSFFVPMMLFYGTIFFGTILSLFSVLPLRIQNWAVYSLGALVLYLVFHFHYQEYGSSLAAIFEGLLFLFWFLGPLLMIFLILVLAGLLINWVARLQVRHHHRPFFAPQRIGPVLVLFAVASIAGSLFVYTPAERAALREMNTLMMESAAARVERQVPEIIREADGAPFFSNAKGVFLLDSNHVLLPAEFYEGEVPDWVEISVTAEFTNDYRITCKFDPITAKILKCTSDYIPPYPSDNG